MKTMKKAILALLTVCVLSVCMILCAANVSAAEVIDSGACGDKVTWTLYNDGELVIDGTGDMWDYTAKTTAPWYTYRKDILSATVKNGVTSIGSYGFYYCQSITKISLPDGLISVGENAFGTSGVKEIEIPASTIEIGDLAFHKCESLNCINVAEENPAFADVDGVLFNKSKTTLIKYPVAKADTKYIIPAGVTCVYDSSFFGCRYLNVVVFADDVKSIGMNAFVGCSKLNAIHITKNIDSIGQRAFAQMNSLTSFSVDKENSSFSVDDYGVLFNKDQTKLIRYPIGNKTTGYSVPAATETIGGWAFENAFCLEKVVMPENVKSFEKSAFSGCSNLKIATVYSRNAEFRDYVFNSTHESFMLYGYSGSTTEAYAAANGHSFSSLAEPARELIASGKCGDNLNWGLYTDGELAIGGDGEMWIWDNNSPWDSYRTSITTVTVKNGVTTIGDSAFCNLNNLINVEISDSVTYIGNFAFRNCSSLTNVTIPDGVTHIGRFAFDSCTSLKSVSIPASVISIDSKVFDRCSSLLRFIVDENNPNYCTDKVGVLFDKNKTVLIQYPAGITANSYTIPESVSYIMDFAFEYCSSLSQFMVDENNPYYSADEEGVLFNKDKTVLVKYPDGRPQNNYIIPNSVTTIDYYAFFNSTGLTSIIIPDSVISLGQYAFSECTGLTNLTIPDSVTSINFRAFRKCTSLTNITIPESVTSIKDGAFLGCTALTNVTVPNSVTSIGESAFDGCTSLTSVSVLSPDMKFGSGVFRRTPVDFTLYGYSGSTTEVYAAENGHSFSSLAEPARELIASGKCGDNLSWELYNDGELIIGGNGEMWNYTLKETAPWNSYASKIAKITVKNGVTTIGSYAFYNCTKVASVSIAEGVTEIGDRAFSHCYNLKTITIPASVIIIGTAKGPFEGCRSLTDIYVAAGNQNYTSLDGVLYDISKTTLIKYPNGKAGVKYGFPESVKSLGDYSFFGNNYLEKVIIPESVSYIGQWAFSASNITSVSIGPNVSSIGARAFAKCLNLKYIFVDENNTCFSADGNGILFNKDQTKLIQYPLAREISSYTVPDTVTGIGGWAFESAAYLEKVQLPENVARIEKSAFLGCGNLKKATVYNSNAIFADFVFSSTNESFELWGYAGSTAEAYATKNGHNFVKLGVPELPIRASGQCGDNLTWVLYGNGELVIDGTGEMWSWSFGTSPWYSHKNSIKTVTMNNGVTTIGDYAFYGLNNLVNVTIPEGVTSFGDSAFSFCLRLSSISIPKTVKTLGQGAIRACRELTTVTIPAGVTSISTYVFADSFKLESIIVDESNPNYCSEDGVLFNKDKTTLIQYPAGKTDETYFVPKTVEKIENGAFYGCRILASISIPQSVISIQAGVFSFCEALTSFVVDENNPCYSSDSDGVLYNKAKTKLMRYPAGKTEAAYTVSDSVSVIDLGSFDGCVYLESIKLPENVVSIYGHAFLGCQKLTSATILCPNAEIDDDVFRDVHSSFTIYGYSGSTAEEHAAKNGFNFVALGESNPVSLPGDINGDASVDIGDAIDLFMHSMLPNQYPIAYSESVDFNKDGSVDIADAILLFMHSMLPNQYPLG